NAQKASNVSGATRREGDLPLQVTRRQEVQDRQRFVAHCRGIALQRRNGGLERHDLLEGMPRPNVVRVGWPTKLRMPFVGHPGLGPAADMGENEVFDAGLVPE